MYDNTSLKYLFDQHNVSTRQDRWLLFLSEDDFEIKHIKEKKNKVADALSRHANLLYASNKYESYLEDKIKNAEKMIKSIINRNRRPHKMN